MGLADDVQNTVTFVDSFTVLSYKAKVGGEMAVCIHPVAKEEGGKKLMTKSLKLNVIYDIPHTSPVGHPPTHIHTLREIATVGDFWHVRCCEQVLKGLAVQRKASTDEGNMCA